MEFRTKVPIPQEEPARKIGYESRIFLAGSCFVENIGQKLDYYKFRSLQNPFGVIFHPFAIENLLQRLVSRSGFTEKDVFFHNERWHSLEAHSVLSSPDKDELLQNLNGSLKNGREFLENSSHVVLTFGTAWHYFHKKAQLSVANCHKLPQQDFEKRLAGPNEIKESISNILKYIQALSPNVRIIFTVSPVRHLKDGVVENQWSKANLISAVQEVVMAQPETCYFPSYEIMMDELRDYRFYGEDMIHPNNTAINYIWKSFSGAHMKPEALKLMEEVEKIRNGLNHRPFNERSLAHQNFLTNLQGRIKDLQKKIPHIRF